MANKTPLLLLPGLLCDDAVWQPQLDRLTGHADCIVADYGLRSSMSAMAEHVLSLASDGPFALAGHSMGGRVAMEVVRQAPQRVSRLALMDTACHGLDPGPAGDDERRGRARLLEMARTQGMRAMGREWARGMVHPSRLDSPVFDDILRMIERKTPDIFAAQIAALLGRPDATPHLGRIQCPTLLLCGRDDAWSPVSRHEDMHALIPGSRLVVIDDCGHMSTMERPDAVTDALLAWLADPPATKA